MIQIQQVIATDGTSQVRPGCSCGHSAISVYPCEEDTVVFCTSCGALTSRGRLVRNLPAEQASAPIRWVDVSTHAECPLLAVAIPIECGAAENDQAPVHHSGTITKISADKCILRLDTPPGVAVLKTQQEVELASEQPPLTGPIHGIVEEVVWTHGQRGLIYYKVRLVLLTLRRKAALEKYFQALYVESTRDPKNATRTGEGDVTLVADAPAPPAPPAAPAAAPVFETQIRRPLSISDEEAVRMLCVASETHDPHISNHLNRISAYSAAVARQLGLAPARVALLATTAKLHDVGKLGVPDAILNKTGALTADERLLMQEHTRFGGRILQASGSELMRLGATIALRHHERHDGGGYPDGLAGEAIPIEARITSVADVFDALTTQRAYKPAWSVEQTIEFMQEQAGRAFDPVVIEAFLRVQVELERTQLRFMDDFRDVWTERRHAARRPTPPVPLSVSIAMPELTFSPHGLTAELHNISSGGAKLLLRDITLDLFTSLVASRRYARLSCTEGPWAALSQVPCTVSWVDYYALPDPSQCLLGLSFQKETPELHDLIASQTHE